MSGTSSPTSVYDFDALSIDGKSAHLATQRGKVLLILDVPYRDVERIRGIVSSRHPEVVLSSQETRYPAFP